MKQTFENVTIYTNGYGISRTDVKSLTVETVKYAQYGAALKVTFIPAGKRKARGMVLTYAPFLVVVKRAEAVDPQSAFLPAEQASPGVTVARGRYTACDSRWQSDFGSLLASRGITPLYSAEGHNPNG